LCGSLPRHFLFRLEMEEVLPQFLRSHQFGRFVEEFRELAYAVPVAQDGTFGQGQEAQVVEEAI
jgi:hypothetical protein